MDSLFSGQIFTQILFIIKQRKLQIVLTTLAVLVPVIFYNEVAPEIYEANVSIIFEDISKVTGKPVHIISSDITNEKIKIFGTKETPEFSIAQAVASSVCIPFLFAPSTFK